MPRGDGTGPAGMGPMTGRAAGYCAGYGTPGFLGAPGWGGPRAANRGGFGPGWYRARPGSRYPVHGDPPPPAGGPYASPWRDAGAEMAALQDQAQWMRTSLSRIEERIRALQSERDAENEA